MKCEYRGIGLEVVSYPKDECMGLYAYQISDGLEIICDFEWVTSNVRKRLSYMKTEIDEIFEDPEPYGYKVVGNELVLL